MVAELLALGQDPNLAGLNGLTMSRRRAGRIGAESEMKPIELVRSETLRVGEREEHGHGARVGGGRVVSARPRRDGHEVVGDGRVTLGGREEDRLEYGVLHHLGGGGFVVRAHGLERSVGGVGAAGSPQGGGGRGRRLFGDGGERLVANGADDGAALAQHLDVLRRRSSSSADTLAPRGVVLGGVRQPRGDAAGAVAQGLDEVLRKWAEAR